ncbi:hypothetical protein GCM10028805_51880 [Spirosoma harenae]
MKPYFTFHYYIAFACIALLSACSRPVAYFQHKAATSATSHQDPAVSDVSSLETSSTITTTAQLPSHINLSQLETYVRNDARLASHKQLRKRMDRLKRLLATSATEKSTNVTPVYQVHKTSAIERLMVKKLNTSVKKHLSPNHPEKPMLNSGLLSGGAILFIGGLLLLLLTTGTGAVIGLIALIIGILALLLGLLAS